MTRNRITLTLDSSQITDFLTCGEYWKLKNYELLATTNKVREDMAMGTYGHKLLEVFYTQLCIGTPFNTAVEIALDTRIDLPHQWERNDENIPLKEAYYICKVCKKHGALSDFITLPTPLCRFPLADETRIAVRNRFNQYWMTYSKHDIEPVMGNAKSVIAIDASGNLVDTIVSEPLVEKGFSYKLLDDANYLFVLEGRIDLIGRLSGQLVWLDHKFQNRQSLLYNKKIQFRNYALATGLDIGIINYVRMHKEVTKDTFTRQIVNFNFYERMQWKNELITIYKQIAHEIETGTKRNRAACDGKYGYACEYTRICDEPSLVTIESIKNTHYTKREKWQPW